MYPYFNAVSVRRFFMISSPYSKMLHGNVHSENETTVIVNLLLARVAHVHFEWICDYQLIVSMIKVNFNWFSS